MSAITKEDLVKSLLRRGELVLRVMPTDEESAEQLLMWMHGNDEDKPMKAELREIAWNKTIVPKEVADAARAIQEIRDIF